MMRQRDVERYEALVYAYERALTHLEDCLEAVRAFEDELDPGFRTRLPLVMYSKHLQEK